MNQLGQKMGLDELARLLMTSTMPVNDREMVIHEIKKLTRRKTESLRVPMSNLYSLATTYYNDDPDAESQRNKLLFTTILLRHAYYQKKPTVNQRKTYNLDNQKKQY
jgi:hypothetical protein